MSSDATISAQVNKLNLNQSSTETDASELVSVVDDLLNQLGSKFMDEMSRRLDNLEATIQAGSAQAASDGEE
ncbi:hypothetical protein B0A48_00203 [Cryoendolithus antarcticus]|uniref:Heat shock factor-binding protein 1 n=1 Tax=Cryoendolithus antarcticus TaxID=1507870 RepID=A0A1V8TU23_9PEZI|nr:hypothetical protein B0A48_00203 [Cryoendolithus antarcticus]